MLCFHPAWKYVSDSPLRTLAVGTEKESCSSVLLLLSQEPGKCRGLYLGQGHGVGSNEAVCSGLVGGRSCYVFDEGD